MEAQPEKVAVLRAGTNIEATIEKSIGLLGGLNLKRDNLVVIKPNICYPKNIDNMVITDLRILEAVLNIVKRRTANILVVESDSFSGTAEKRASATGVIDIVKKCGAEFLNLSRDEVEAHNVAGFTLHIPKTVLKADYFVNLPKVKTHTFVQISVAMKNMFGVLADNDKDKFHSRLADVVVYLNQTIRQDLIIADGIIAMEGLGPIHGKLVNLGLIISGRNPVSVDAVCCHIAGFNPYDIEVMRKAQQLEMGEIDIEQIRILGEKIEDVKTKLSNPYFTPKNVFAALKTGFKLYTKR